MSVQFKIKDGVAEGRRQEIVAALGRAGYDARTLFPGQKRASLASIFTIPRLADAKAVQAALSRFGRDIEYVEVAPQRSLKR